MDEQLRRIGLSMPRERGSSPCGPATVEAGNLLKKTLHCNACGKSQILGMPEPGDLTLDNFRRPTEYRSGYVPCPCYKGRYAQQFIQAPASRFLTASLSCHPPSGSGRSQGTTGTTREFANRQPFSQCNGDLVCLGCRIIAGRSKRLLQLPSRGCRPSFGGYVVQPFA